MSARAVIIAVLGGIFIATVGYFNDQVPRLNHFVGNQFPIIVFFPLILAAAAFNPLLARLRRTWRLSSAELAVIVGLLLVACNIPGSGLLRWWSRAVAVPVMYEQDQSKASWRATKALGYAPPALLVNEGKYDKEFFDSFWSGSTKPIALSDVPWGAWKGPLIGWMPIVVIFAGASICLALVVHRSWSTRERLPYPVAQLATALVEAGDGGAGSIFRKKHFLFAAGMVFMIHVVNGGYMFLTKQGFRDPIFFDCSEPILAKFPDIWLVPWGGNSVFYFAIFPTLVAFACFVASDVAFSVGISVPVWTVIGLWLIKSGVSIEWVATAGGVVPWQTAGSAVAIGLVLLYLGRRFYLGLLWQAVPFIRRRRETEGYEVWACRLFLLSIAGLVAILVSLNVAWTVAIPAVLLIMLMHVVMARITVESGLILAYMMWNPLAVLLGLMGATALGPYAVATVGMVCVIFTFEARECLMPLVLNGLQVCNAQKISSAKVGSAGMVVFLIALAAAVPFSIWVDHRFGVSGGEGFSTGAAPACTFDLISTQSDYDKWSPTLELSKGYAPLERILNMEPDRACVISMAVGAAVVLGLMWLRLRFMWWPIHPILFVIWGTWAMRVAGYSFLLGWAIKAVSRRLGVKFATLRIFMIGVIVGDLTGGALWMIVGAVYWAITGFNPPRYHVFPGG